MTVRHTAMAFFEARTKWLAEEPREKSRLCLPLLLCLTSRGCLFKVGISSIGKIHILLSIPPKTKYCLLTC